MGGTTLTSGVFGGSGSFVDRAGRPISSVPHRTSDILGMAPLALAALHLDLRAVRHDYKIERLRTLFEHYASGAATSEHLGCECLLTLCSQLADKSTDDLIAEFAIEPMRDYLASER